MKDEMKLTSIMCMKGLKDKLCKLDFALKGMTYEQIINGLIEYYEGNKK